MLKKSKKRPLFRRPQRPFQNAKFYPKWGGNANDTGRGFDGIFGWHFKDEGGRMKDEKEQGAAYSRLSSRGTPRDLGSRIRFDRPRSLGVPRDDDSWRPLGRERLRPSSPFSSFRLPPSPFAVTLPAGGCRRIWRCRRGIRRLASSPGAFPAAGRACRGPGGGFAGSLRSSARCRRSARNSLGG